MEYGTPQTKSESQIRTIVTRPEIAVTDYFKIKTKPISKKSQQGDVPRLNPTADLALARKDLIIAGTCIEKKKQEQIHRRKELNAEWEALKKEEIELQKFFNKFNNFVEDNEEKRTRFMKRILEEKEAQQKIENNIEHFLGKIKKFKAIGEEMEYFVGKYSIYESFLRDVVAGVPELTNAKDLLNRYTTLAEVKEELARQQQENLRVLVESRVEMVELTEENVQSLIALAGKLQCLQNRYNGAKERIGRWTDVVSKIRKIVPDTISELSQVSESIWNLYTRMCGRKGLPVEISRKNVEEQLTFIKNTIQELQRIKEKILHRRGINRKSFPQAVGNSM